MVEVGRRRSRREREGKQKIKEHLNDMNNNTKEKKTKHKQIMNTVNDQRQKYKGK